MQIPSDDNSATLHALFPTLVYQVHCDEHAEWNPLFTAALSDFGFAQEGGSGSKHFAGEYHGKILLHQHSPLSGFFIHLAEHVAKYLRTLGMKPHVFDMQCLKTWFVLCEPGQEGDSSAMLPHNHSCSDVSWVYYVDVPDDISPIRFHAGQQLKTAPFGSAFHYDWQNENKSAVDRLNWWNRETWSIQPKAGDLLLFPGHQLHSIDANQSANPRISVAGDIALTLREEYKDLEFGRTAQSHWLTLPLIE